MSSGFVEDYIHDLWRVHIGAAMCDFEDTFTENLDSSELSPRTI